MAKSWCALLPLIVLGLLLCPAIGADLDANGDGEVTVEEFLSHQVGLRGRVGWECCADAAGVLRIVVRKMLPQQKRRRRLLKRMPQRQLKRNCDRQRFERLVTHARAVC